MTTAATRSSAAALAAASWIAVAVLLLMPGAFLHWGTAWVGDLLGWRQSSSAPCSGLWCLDKLIHLLVFTWLSWLTARIDPSSRRAQLLAAVGVTAYSWLLEGLQGWLGWRETDLLDGVSNTVGVVLGVVLGRWLGWWRN